MYDLIIKDGRVIDPVQKIDESMDVAVTGDKIAALSAGHSSNGSPPSSLEQRPRRTSDSRARSYGIARG